MKKFAFRSLSLLCVVAGLVSLSANAEQVAPLAAAPTSKDADAAKFEPTAYVLGRYALYDSTRKSDFDFVKQIFRLGVKYSQGKFFATGEAEFEGNSNGQGPVDNSSSSAVGGATSVRQAFVGVNAFEGEVATLGFTLGRFIPVGAKMYGNDAITGQYALSGFMPMDGVMAQMAGNFFFGTLNAQFAVVNNVPVWVYSSSVPATAPALPTGTSGAANTFFFPVTSGSSTAVAAGNGFSTPSTTSRKGYVANITASVDVGPGKVEAAVAGASQFRAVQSQQTSSSNSGTARDVTYVEASLGYNYQDTLKGGAWYSYTDLSDVYSSGNDFNGGAPTYSLPGSVGTSSNNLATVNPRDQFTQYGVGVQGSSKFLGMTNFFAKDDAFTAGLGYQQFLHRQNGGVGGIRQSDAANCDVSQVSLGLGYVKGPMNFELNYAMFASSGGNTFLNQGQNNYTNSAHVAYLVGSYVL